MKIYCGHNIDKKILYLKKMGLCHLKTNDALFLNDMYYKKIINNKELTEKEIKRISKIYQKKLDTTV